jgi:hypothetical protein
MPADSEDIARPPDCCQADQAQWALRNLRKFRNRRVQGAAMRPRYHRIPPRREQFLQGLYRIKGQQLTRSRCHICAARVEYPIVTLPIDPTGAP